MSVIAFGSAKAAPGVTTTVVALAAAWPESRKVLIVEADPDGGVLAARHQLGSEPGLSTLAVTSRRALTAAGVIGHSQSLSSAEVRALVAPPAAEQTRRALALVAAPLGHILPQLDQTDTLIDVGRFRPDSEANPFVVAADAVVLVVRPRLEELQQLPARLRAIRTATSRVGLLLVGDRPYPPAEVAVALGAEVVAVIANDATAAEALPHRAGATSLARSTLMRSARSAVEAVDAWLRTTSSARQGRGGADSFEGGLLHPAADAGAFQ